MAHQIIVDLSNIINSTFYSIICDEYTDISNKEQLTRCLRWVDDSFNSHEDFIGFYQVPNIKSDTLVMVIKDIRIRLQIPLQRCRGQCYDGASNMLGKKSGVAKQIYVEQPKAHYTHCHCHSLDLSVKDVTTTCKVLSDSMDVAGEIAIWIKFSPKREQMLVFVQRSRSYKPREDSSFDSFGSTIINEYTNQNYNSIYNKPTVQVQ